MHHICTHCTLYTPHLIGPVGLEYHPLCARSDEALHAILDALGIQGGGGGDSSGGGGGGDGGKHIEAKE